MSLQLHTLLKGNTRDTCDYVYYEYHGSDTAWCLNHCADHQPGEVDGEYLPEQCWDKGCQHDNMQRDDDDNRLKLRCADCGIHAAPSDAGWERTRQGDKVVIYCYDCMNTREIAEP